MFEKLFKKVQILSPITPLPLARPDVLVETKMQEILNKHLPPESFEYCYKLWQEVPFSFKISRVRSTCFGNYTFRDNQHIITINHDLNSYAFLITYIHEIAHQRVWLKKTRKKIEPHGKEWKQQFQELMLPILNHKVFPEHLLKPLSDYMKNPAASSVSYAPLTEALRTFDEYNHISKSLSEIKDKDWFIFRGNTFQRLELRRTRVLCLEKTSKRKYTILATAQVEPI